ncbi:uncharacterized protein E0L32_004675 [Thyridium curvatum]|uniref:Uncharacterized protein n=1 Tax=Thyridium curvatum TaxID=1093900 RepID=A0A507B5S7_9PEZI|nr:uncharacterized protein E0L32_004675 [Thyridium curvatum]TPX15117.1 hypothetical protein E0L32_004675 [Thyridium curvatum]
MHARTSQGLTVLALAALISTTQATLAMVIGVPACAANGHGDAKGIWETSAEDCQKVIYAMDGKGAELFHPPEEWLQHQYVNRNSCLPETQLVTNLWCSRTVAKEGKCEVFLCGNGHGDAEISAGAIATAAADIHAFCRLNGNAGGRTTVYTQEGDGLKNSALVQLGQIHKDELKKVKRGEEELPEEEDLLKKDSLINGHHLELPGPRGELSKRRAERALQTRSDPDDYDNGDGANEGEQHDIDPANVMQLATQFVNDMRRVFAEPNPNFRNTAGVRMRFQDRHRNRQVYVTMAYLAADGRTVVDLQRASRDSTLSDMVGRVVGGWHMGGFRTFFTNHIWRFQRGNPNGPHTDLGRIAINVEDVIPDYPLPPLAMIPGGSLN